MKELDDFEGVRQPYADAVEIGAKYEKLLKEILKFNEVTTYTDLGKP